MRHVTLAVKRDYFPMQLKLLVFVIEMQCVVMNHAYSGITTMVAVT